MILKKLGFYKKPLKGTSHNLSEYSVDANGQVWSNNNDTYVTKYGRYIAQGQGQDATVTLRDDNGKKVSISRKKLVKAYNLGRTGNF